MTPTAPFDSWDSFRGFAHSVRHQSRFFHDLAVTRFLESVAASAEGRLCTMKIGKTVWRAQIGHDWVERHASDDFRYDEPSPLSVERMKPLKGSAHEGRVNPRGIPCLYTASDKETAVAEVRPWLGALVSVARLSAKKDLRLVDCSEEHVAGFDLYLEQPEAEEREKAVWRAIGRAFSEPVSPDPAVAEYVPTQVLAENFRRQNYDGVIYKSRLGRGFSIVTFDLDVLDILDVRLYPVASVSCSIGELQNSYVVKRERGDAS